MISLISIEENSKFLPPSVKHGFNNISEALTDEFRFGSRLYWKSSLKFLALSVSRLITFHVVFILFVHVSMMFFMSRDFAVI